MAPIQEVLITGGAGYVGAVLVPKLLAKGYSVRVLDLYMFDDHVFDSLRDHPHLRQSLSGVDAVIHLACISNDPSFELNPELSKSINFDAFEPLVHISKDSGVRRFVYASTSSVYGVSESPEVTEDHPLVPITDYNKYKGLCEPILADYQSADFTTVTIRPATVCGYSPRQRLDLSVNILTNHAINKGRITVFGGAQMRPNIHIEDIVRLYMDLLEMPSAQIAGKIFNAGWENHTISDIAEMVRSVVATEVPGRANIEVVTTPSDDRRSYHISSDKIRRELGFAPQHTIEDAVRDLVRAFQDGRIPDAMDDIRYYNVKKVQEVGLN